MNVPRGWRTTSSRRFRWGCAPIEVQHVDETSSSQQFTHQKFHGECTGGLRESSSLCANEKNDLINILP